MKGTRFNKCQSIILVVTYKYENYKKRLAQICKLYIETKEEMSKMFCQKSDESQNLDMWTFATQEVHVHPNGSKLIRRSHKQKGNSTRGKMCIFTSDKDIPGHVRLTTRTLQYLIIPLLSAALLVVGNPWIHFVLLISRILGALWVPTSSWRTFGPLAFSSIQSA